MEKNYVQAFLFFHFSFSQIYQNPYNHTGQEDAAPDDPAIGGSSSSGIGAITLQGHAADKAQRITG